MSKNHIALVLAALGALLLPPALFGQDAASDTAGVDRPRVFFDCRGPQCDNTYHRTEIPWVSWVRDQQDVHLHVVMTSQSTGANGREYQLDFMGREEYEDYEDQTLIQSLPTDTQRERLDGVSYALGLGFARFAQYAGFRGIVRLESSQGGPDFQAIGLVSSEEVQDPWNLWVFRINGNGNFNGESTRTTRRFSGGFSASRVTPTWKQNYGSSVNYNFQETEFTDRDPFVDERTDWSVFSTVVYSLAQY